MAALAEEELDLEIVLVGWCDAIFRCEVRDCGEAVEFADGGVGVVEVEMGERGCACASVKAMARERYADAMADVNNFQ